MKIKRNDYRTRVKAMSDAELLRYIDRKLDHLIAVGEDLNKLIYAKELAKKRGLLSA